jgi:hypothetical protein
MSDNTDYPLPISTPTRDACYFILLEQRILEWMLTADIRLMLTILDQHQREEL